MYLTKPYNNEFELVTRDRSPWLSYGIKVLLFIYSTISMNIWSAGNYIFETDYGKRKTKAEQPHTMKAARNVVWL